ncbi:MAG: MATE family efflux transporter, partial [Thermoflexaceae bacterium]|nr:MATE family efflux transporter [Thermoflexaceae bacterium]
MDKQEKRDLILNGNLLTVIVTLAVPIVINSFIQTMYNLTDTYWLGQLGTDHQSAITIVTPIQNIILNFGQGITTAGSILISQYLGARKDDEANIMARHIFLCSILFSVTCSTVCFFCTPAIVTWLGATDNIYTYACTYLQIVILDMPLLFTINMFTAVYQSQGNTLHPMLLNLLGIIINMILDPLLMITFDMGVAGAAIATLTAKIPCALIALWILTRKNRLIYLTYKGFHFEKEKFSSILKVGLPTAIGGSTMQFGFLLMSKNVLKYGSIATSAYGIGNKINSLITLPSNAMGSATATIVGQNIGARQKERAEK